MSEVLVGHIFVHDSIRLDYCILEAVNSLIPVCDHVLVVDCSSTDGTDQLLVDAFGQNPKVMLVTGHKWDVFVGGGGERLRLIAEDCRAMAKEMLNATWQFMLQADEVLHERSYPHIQRIVQANAFDRYFCRRVDLWLNTDRCLFLDIGRYRPGKRPMQPNLVRLARIDVPAVQDAGQLDPLGAPHSEMENVVLYHYSFVRDGIKLNHKVLEMFEWYFGKKHEPDDRVAQWSASGRPFDGTWLKTLGETDPIPYPHPIAAVPWVKKHAYVGDHLRAK